MNKNIPITPKPIIREINCIWEYVDEKDQLQKEKITVLYRSRTVAESREFNAKFKGDDLVYLSELLCGRIHRLPDILGDEEVTLEFLEMQDVANLKHLSEAIADSENPKK